MGEMAPEGQEAVPTGQEDTGSQESGGSSFNPAWSDLMGVIPEDLHEQVTPHLQKWDQNFDKVQSQYAPYKQFVDAKVSADNIAYALNVMQEIENDPQKIYEALGKYMQENGLLPEAEQNAQGQEQNSDQGQVGEDGLPDISNHPKFQELEKLVQTYGQAFIEQQQRAQEEAEDAELQDQIDTLTEELGEFDVKWVLHAALDAAESGEDVNDLRPFVDQYRQYEQGIIEKSRKPAPTMMPAGGQQPKSEIDFKSMSDGDRRKFIVDRLNLARQQQD